VRRLRGRGAATSCEDWQRGEPELAVGDLAQQLGYYDQAHFIHEFKRMTGWLPMNTDGDLRASAGEARERKAE